MMVSPSAIDSLDVWVTVEESVVVPVSAALSLEPFPGVFRASVDESATVCRCVHGERAVSAVSDSPS